MKGRKSLTVVILVLVGITVNAQVQVQDSLALVALYNATGGPAWTNNTNWLQPGKKVSTWYGVTLDVNVVLNVNLYNNNLVGTIPDAIGDLGSLVSLTLAENHLSGAIPTSIKKLTKLGFITLAGNEYTGEMPSFLLALPAIQYVVLSDNGFTSVAPLQGKSSSLRGIFIDGNMLDFADIEHFFNPTYPGLFYSPQATIYTASAVTVREGASITLKTTAAGSANQYQWLKDNTALPGATQANYTWTIDLTDAGNYTAQVTNTIAPDLTLERNPITLNVKNDTVYASCKGLAITLSAAVADPQATYRWSTGATTPSIVADTSGKYGVQIETTDYIVKDTLRVVIPATLSLGQTVDVCASSAPLASNVSADSYEWQIPDGSTSNQSTLTATMEGRYILTIKQQECTQKDSVNVILNHFTQGEFSISAGSAPVEYGDPVLTKVPLIFTNTTGTGKDFTWSFGDAATSSEENSAHAYSEAGQYLVVLSGTDDRNCPITVEKTIRAQDLVITNAISPNGDGQNDKLYVEPFLYSAELKVMNRWGQEVYKNSSYHDDFTGTSLESGVYYYELHFKEIDKDYKGYFHIMK
jgi:gliding motility-associated-like protein